MRTLLVTLTVVCLAAGSSTAWAQDILRPIPSGPPPLADPPPAAPGGMVAPTWVRAGEAVPSTQASPNYTQTYPGRPLLFPRLGGRLFRRTWTVPASGPVSSAPVETPAARTLAPWSGLQHATVSPAPVPVTIQSLQPGMPLSEVEPAAGTDASGDQERPVRTGPFGLIRR
jgi:hypothetical protein